MQEAQAKTKKKISTGEHIVDIFSGIIDWVFIIFFLAIFLFACYAIYDSAKVYDETKLPSTVLDKVKVSEDGQRTIDFESLSAENSDIAAWIVIDGTNIDYPVMHVDNNSFYLAHGFDKQYANTGSIFLDYRNTAGWSDDYNLIYGHNMNGDVMFGQLNRFRETDFFNQNGTGKLYTPGGNYSLNLIAELVTDKDNKEVYDVLSLKNDTPRVKKFIDATATQKRDLDKADKIIALTTCRGLSGMRQIVYFRATKD